jgi:DNA-binding transcriptional LysR family regulator
MDDGTRLPDWNQLRALLATVEAGSLSAAARRLGLTQPTLGRQVAALEQSLRITIFERVGRSLVLTEAGQQLVTHVRAMGAAADQVAVTAAGQSQSVEGVVRITAADIYAAYVLPPMLERLREAAPGITLEVMAVNSISDLVRREADIAIRHVRPEQDGLVARRCRDTAARIYGAPDYLDRVGRPEEVADLAGSAFAGSVEDNSGFIEEMQRRGVTLGPGNFPLATQSGVAAWEWVRRGICLSPMVESVAEATGGVEVVLPKLDPIAVPVWLVTHRELRTSARIRLVFDVLAEMLG